jgi:hypothetical protein
MITIEDFFMGTKRPHCRRNWDADLKELGKRLGFEVIRWDGYPSKRHKVLIKCVHKEQWVYPNGQFGKKHCCKVASKLAENNPAFGKLTWNAGTIGISTGHGFGGKPRGEEALLPGILYLVNYRDEDGDHIKVGITKRTVEERLKSRLVSVIVTHKATLGECFDLEQQFLEDFSEFRYSSSTTTELIQVDQLQKAIEYLCANS